MNKNIIVITGPTASGKTDFALKLADFADIEIISADSRQIYKYMNIGTAKPLPEELKKVKHYIIDLLNPDEEFNAGKFAGLSVPIINDIIRRKKIPVIAGGTGFYIKALFDGLSPETESDKERRLQIRNELNGILESNGKDFLYEILKEEDKISAEKYADKNPRRVLRALEYIKLNAQKFSDTFGMENPSGFVPQYYVINPPREELYKKINLRTEKMYENGLIRETAGLIEMGYTFELNSMNTVGYKECTSLILGQYDLNRAIELTKQNTRHYAKRQITWLNQFTNYEKITSVNEYLFQNIIDKYHS